MRDQPGEQLMPWSMPAGPASEQRRRDLVTGAKPGQNVTKTAIRHELLRRYTVEVTCKDVQQVCEAHRMIPSNTRVNVTALDRDQDADRVAAIAAIAKLGLRPVPHIAARRLTSESQLSRFMKTLVELGASNEVFVIGGDAREPEGPFDNALQLIESGVLPEHGVRRVGVAAYPEGHPSINDNVLREDFASKVRALGEQGLDAYAITQFCFDAQAVSHWLRDFAQENHMEMRIGVPGPATVRRLLRYASLFGAKSSSRIVRKYGLSLTNLMSIAKPSAFVEELVDTLPDPLPVSASLHFYPFGAIEDTIAWINEFDMQVSHDGNANKRE